MNKFDWGQSVNTLANIGVIAGIAFLAVELNQNNQILELEARATHTEYMQAGWDRLTENPELVNLFIKDRNGEELSESEAMRMNAWWMSYLVRLEFQFEHFPDSNVRREAARRIYASYPSFRKTWSGDHSTLRGSGKDNFSPEFIRFVDEQISMERGSSAVANESQ